HRQGGEGRTRADDLRRGGSETHHRAGDARRRRADGELGRVLARRLPQTPRRGDVEQFLDGGRVGGSSVCRVPNKALNKNGYVMAGLVPAIPLRMATTCRMIGVAGTSPATTGRGWSKVS